MLLTLKAGGTGLNLQSFDSVYLAEPAWNHSSMLQGLSRAARIGQLNKVEVHIFWLEQVCTLYLSHAYS